MMWRQKKTVLLLGSVFGVYMAFAFVNPWEGNITLAELVLQLSGSRGAFSLGCSLPELMRYVLRMIPCYVVIMILGNSLYSHFCTASIYVFSRCTNRLKWYGQTALSLLGDVCLFEILFTGTVILVTMVRYKIIFSPGGFLLLGYHILIYVMWIFTWVLLMNLCAMKTGSGTAFMVIMGILAVCTASLSLVHKMEVEEVSKDTIERFLSFNPVAHTILGWHGGAFAQAELAGNRYSMNLRVSAAVLFLFCLAVLLAGGALVQRHELLTEDIELGAA